MNYPRARIYNMELGSQNQKKAAVLGSPIPHNGSLDPIP